MENSSSPKFLTPGQTISIDQQPFEIENVEHAREKASSYGWNLNREVPIYYLKGYFPGAQAHYFPAGDYIMMYSISNEHDLKHEIAHAIEFPQEKTPALIDIYEKAKEKVTEDSFDGSVITYNFTKNISEFIADGYTKKPFIDALIKEGLYDDFLKESAYLFK